MLRVFAAFVLAWVIAASAHGAVRGPAIVRAAHDIEAHTGSARLILLGEQHAAREIPRLVARLVGAYAMRGPVTLALEIPWTEQGSLDAALAARDANEARDKLLARRWWQPASTQHDGRRSEDMLDLIEHLRALRTGGHTVSLLAYDVDVDADAPPHNADWRDREITRRLRAGYETHPGRLLVLGGNVHAMIERPAYAPPQMQQPAGSFLRDLAPVSIHLMARKGEAWGCTEGRCSARRIDLPMAQSGAGQGEYTWTQVPPRFTLARLPGDPPKGGAR